MDLENIKNEVSQTSVYHKFNSFHHLSVKDNSDVEVRNRLKKLYDEFDTQDTSYKQKIVGRALRDLFDPDLSNPIRFELHANVLEELKRLDEGLYPRYLFYRYRYEVFPQTKELDDYPPCLQIEPSAVCNYRCVFCYQTDETFSGKKSEHMGVLSLDLFKKIVDEAQGHVDAITLASRGEPFLNRGFREMLAYMDGKFLATKINSNASLMTEKMAHAILQSNVQTLVISADAAEPTLYGKLRVRGDLETVLKNVRLFKDIKEKQYPQSRLITRVSGVKVSSSQDLDDMSKVWGDLVEQIAFVAYNPWENTYERELSHIEEPCTDLWRRAFVWWDGLINPCDVDYKSVLACGNIKEKSLTELWRGEKYENLRKAHLCSNRNKKFPCNRCTVI